MPADPKYLTKSKSQKFAKITSGFIGGAILTCLIQLCVAILLPESLQVNFMVLFAVFLFFIVWVVLFTIPFLFKNGWNAWLLYLLVSIGLFGLYWLVK